MTDATIIPLAGPVKPLRPLRPEPIPEAKTLPWTLVDDATGFVVMRTQGHAAPVREGCSALQEDAPQDSYRFDGVWVALAPQPSAFHVWRDRQWVDPRTLDELRAAKLVELRAAFEALSAAAMAGYSPAERQTWASQETEVLAWAADSSSSTPFLDGLAKMRGIDPLELRNRTLAKVSAFRSATQALLGTLQGLRDALKEAASREQIECVSWPSASG